MNLTEANPSLNLLDCAATATVKALLGSDESAKTVLGLESTPTREALTALIKENYALLASGNTEAMAAALGRQATALELGMQALLYAMTCTENSEHRLALAKAAATLHAASLRALSAVHEVTRSSCG